jgi:hypothetical protein
MQQYSSQAQAGQADDAAASRHEESESGQGSNPVELYSLKQTKQI